MPQKRVESSEKRNRGIISGVLTGIDISTAVLLLTGQVTSNGVFISPGGMWLSLAGPIVGGSRIHGKSIPAGAVIDGIDVITAFLLILGQLRMQGPWIYPGGVNLVVSGPAFGINTVPVAGSPNEKSETFFRAFRSTLANRFVPTDILQRD